MNANAEEPDTVRVHLEYQRAEDTPNCPDATELRNTVAARLGYDPFTEGGDRSIVANTSLQEDEEGRSFLTGQVELHEGSGELAGARTLESEALDCRELAEAMVLAIVIAIDPLALSRPPQEELEPETPEEQEPETPEEQPWGAPPVVTARQSSEELEEVDAPPDERQLRARVRIGAHASLWSGPRITAGFVVHGGIRWRGLSIGLEGRADLPSRDDQLGGEIKTTLLLLALVPCFHWRMMAVCGVFGGGALLAEGIGYRDPQKTSSQYWVTGGRLGVEIPIVGPLIIHGRIDILGAPVRTNLTIDDEVAWTTPPVSFAFGAGISGSF